MIIARADPPASQDPSTSSLDTYTLDGMREGGAFTPAGLGVIFGSLILLGLIIASGFLISRHHKQKKEIGDLEEEKSGTKTNKKVED